MTPERYQLIGQLFDEALERPPDERTAYLEQACGDDAQLRGEVEKLLANHSDSKEFLSRPAMDVAAELLSKNRSTFAQGKEISHYKIFSLLGEGGMGQVYLAEDTRLRRKVALKVLPETIAKDKIRLRRFEQEALAASALNHPNILTIYEFGSDGETQFLASEFIDGETARDYWHRDTILLEKVLDVAVQTAQALAAAHDAGIVHRDIKPENLMIRNDGLVKVLDFGLAKLLEHAPLDTEGETRIQGLTQSGVIVGTVPYMSPEQARGKTVDARTDVFSLGVVLFEMLTRRHPFLGETVSHTMVAVLEKDPPPLAQFFSRVPPELEGILHRALAKDPADRYANGASLLADLKKLQKRLEFAAELSSHSVAAKENNEAATQMIPITNELARETDKIPARATAQTRSRSARIWLIAGLAALILVSVAAWQWLIPAPAGAPSAVATDLPERNLSYSLTVQKYRDGKPYQGEFQSSGREIFEAGWKFRLNLTSPQEGFLYLLNQEPSGNFVLLFPLPSHNNGSAHLDPNERLQTGWYVFDNKPGTERFRLVWGAETVPELEQFRGLVNPTDKGRITDPVQNKRVSEFLNQHDASQVGSEQDQRNKLTNIRGRGTVLVALVELEHH